MTKQEKENLQNFYKGHYMISQYSYSGPYNKVTDYDNFIDSLDTKDELSQKFLKAVTSKFNALVESFDPTEEETKVFENCSLNDFKAAEKDLETNKDAYLLQGLYLQKKKDLEFLQTRLRENVYQAEKQLREKRILDWKLKNGPLYRAIFENLKRSIDNQINQALEEVKA